MEDVEIARWMNGLREFDAYNQSVLCAMFSVFGVPYSYLDIGCGSGVMVRMAHVLGIDAYGVDRLPHPEAYFREHDLTQPLDLDRSFQLVSSIEVAEHIVPEAESIYSDTLASHIMPGGILVLTSAPPGQPGDGHVNCQPAEYWRGRMHCRGVHYSAEWTYRLALAWSISNHPMHWLEANLQVFMR
jgi:hypothetical protein